MIDYQSKASHALLKSKIIRLWPMMTDNQKLMLYEMSLLPREKAIKAINNWLK